MPSGSPCAGFTLKFTDTAAYCGLADTGYFSDNPYREIIVGQLQRGTEDLAKCMADFMK